MVRDFLHLFRGNPAVVGLDDAGHGVPGPLRLDIPDEREQQWLALVEGHLSGHRGIGVYPVNHARAGSVAWGCVDFDEGEVESWSHALNLRELLHGLDVPVWIERSRSKGYHVWLFSGDWVAARWMRRLLLGACNAVDAPSKEVNPKSEKLDDTQLGNFVRLPYFNKDNWPIRHQVMVDLLGEPLSFELFIDMALEQSITEHRLIQVAKLLYHPPRLRRRSKVKPGPWQDKLNSLALRQLADGPKPDSKDRSGYLWAFGQACAESGLDQDEIERAVRVADLLHTHKYEGRKDSPERYGDIARKAIEQQEAASW